MVEVDVGRINITGISLFYLLVRRDITTVIVGVKKSTPVY